MSATRCVHGMDPRFCAICNRGTRGGASPLLSTRDTSVAELLRFLNDTRTRATYGAVAAVLGVPARSVGQMLGDRRPEASWVVSADTDLPSGYEPADWHPALLETSTVIRTANELTLRLIVWQRGRMNR